MKKTKKKFQRQTYIELLKALACLNCFITPAIVLNCEPLRQILLFAITTVVIWFMTSTIYELGHVDCICVIAKRKDLFTNSPDERKKLEEILNEYDKETLDNLLKGEESLTVSLFKYRNSVMAKAMHIICLVAGLVYLGSYIACVYYAAISLTFSWKGLLLIFYIIMLGVINRFTLQNIRQSCKDSEIIDDLL